MFMQIIYELVRGFAYRRIRHGNMRLYTTWLPLALAALLVAIYLVLPTKPILVGPKGLATSLLSVLSILPGFYFAGLAAVATFGNPTMDQEMPNPAPEVVILVSGAPVVTKLTRRLFLSYLFSYLVLVSFMLCFMAVALNAISSSIDVWHGALVRSTGTIWSWSVLKGIFGSVIAFAFASMLISTLHGVFFLSEKIHQP